MKFTHSIGIYVRKPKPARRLLLFKDSSSLFKPSTSEIGWILPGYFFKKFIKIRQTIDPHGITGLAHIIILHQQILRPFDPILINKLRKGHIRLPPEIPAKGRRGEVDFLSHHIDIGLTMIFGIDVFIYSPHPDLILQNKVLAAEVIIQDRLFIRVGQDLENVYQL